MKLLIMFGLLLFLTSCETRSAPPKPDKMLTHNVTCHCDHYLETCICAGRVYKLYVQAEVEEIPDL